MRVYKPIFRIYIYPIQTSVELSYSKKTCYRISNKIFRYTRILQIYSELAYTYTDSARRLVPIFCSHAQIKRQAEKYYFSPFDLFVFSRKPQTLLSASLNQMKTKLPPLSAHFYIYVNKKMKSSVNIYVYKYISPDLQIQSTNQYFSPLAP